MTQEATDLSIQTGALQRTPIEDLVQRAFDRGDLELVQRAMELQERWEKNQARKAFDAAMAAVRAELPIIIKNRKTDFENRNAPGRTKYDYEDLAGIASQIDGVLAKHGLSYRFRTQVGDKMLTVTCIVSHAQGYSEENSLSGPHDVSGNKNPIQAVGSIQTYLQRYTLKAALGLAAGADTDGGLAAADEPVELINVDQIETIEKALEVRGMPLDRFIKGVAAATHGQVRITQLNELPAKLYDVSLKKIRQAENPQ